LKDVIKVLSISMLLVLVVCSLPFIAIFTTYSVNALLDKHDMLYENKVGEFLEPGEVWEESKFQFEISNVKLLSKEEAENIFSKNVDLNEQLICQLTFSLKIKEGFEGTGENFELYTGSYDSLGKATGKTPRPDKILPDDDSQTQLYIVLVPENSDYVSLNVVIPDESKNLYKKVYRIDLGKLR